MYSILRSINSAQTDVLVVPRYMSEVETDLARYVHKKSELLNRIGQKGYQSVTVEEIIELILLKMAPIRLSLLAARAIQNAHSSQHPDSHLRAQSICANISTIIALKQQRAQFIRKMRKHQRQYENDKYADDGVLSLSYYMLQKIRSGKEFGIAFSKTVSMIDETIERVTEQLKSEVGADFQGIMKAIEYKCVMCG